MIGLFSTESDIESESLRTCVQKLYRDIFVAGAVHLGCSRFNFV